MLTQQSLALVWKTNYGILSFVIPILLLDVCIAAMFKLTQKHNSGYIHLSPSVDPGVTDRTDSSSAPPAGTRSCSDHIFLQEEVRTCALFYLFFSSVHDLQTDQNYLRTFYHLFSLLKMFW